MYDIEPYWSFVVVYRFRMELNDVVCLAPNDSPRASEVDTGHFAEYLLPIICQAATDMILQCHCRCHN